MARPYTYATSAYAAGNEVEAEIDTEAFIRTDIKVEKDIAGKRFGHWEEGGREDETVGGKQQVGLTAKGRCGDVAEMLRH